MALSRSPNTLSCWSFRYKSPAHTSSATRLCYHGPSFSQHTSSVPRPTRTSSLLSTRYRTTWLFDRRKQTDSLPSLRTCQLASHTVPHSGPTISPTTNRWVSMVLILTCQPLSKPSSSTPLPERPSSRPSRSFSTPYDPCSCTACQ